MATVTLKLKDDLAKELREFAVKKTGAMRGGLSTIAEEAITEYLEKHKAEVMKA
jgi:predicted transcriptional regulator